MTFNVPQVHFAPLGLLGTALSANITVAQGGQRVLTANDFGFTDPNDSPADAPLSVKFTTFNGMRQRHAHRHAGQ